MSGNYIFDANGAPIGFKYRGADYASGVWDTYAYEKNVQGDIVAVYDTATGIKLISYIYITLGVHAVLFTTIVDHLPRQLKTHLSTEDITTIQIWDCTIYRVGTMIL